LLYNKTIHTCVGFLAGRQRATRDRECVSTGAVAGRCFSMNRLGTRYSPLPTDELRHRRSPSSTRRRLAWTKAPADGPRRCMRTTDRLTSVDRRCVRLRSPSVDVCRHTVGGATRRNASRRVNQRTGKLAPRGCRCRTVLDGRYARRRSFGCFR